MTHKGHIEFRPATEVRGRLVDLNLDDVFGRIEIRKRKIGSEQKQEVGLMHRIVSAPPTNQARHAHRVGILPFEPLLAPVGVPHRSLELGGQCHHLVMCLFAAGPTKNRDLFRSVDRGGQRAQVSLTRPEHGRVVTDRLKGVIRRVLGRHVSRDRDDRRSVFSHGHPDGRLDHGAGLLWIHNSPGVARGNGKKSVGIQLFEHSRINHGADRIASDCDHRSPFLPGINQSVDEVGHTRTSRTAHRDWLAGQIPFR